MHDSFKKLFWDDKAGCFVRTITFAHNQYTRETTMDASLIGPWYFGIFAPDDPLIVKTMEAMRAMLMVKTEVGGMARYKNDYYHQVSNDIKLVPGINPGSSAPCGWRNGTSPSPATRPTWPRPWN